MKQMLSRVLVLAGLLAVVGACATGAGRAAASRSPAAPAAVRALVGGRVITGPDRAPIEDGVVLVQDGRITAVGPRESVEVPAGAEVVDTRGATVLAGFWNVHVHFMGEEWQGAAAQHPSGLEVQLRRMLTRWGFVHVVDTGSALDNTLALRRRIESGEVRGPSIIAAGPPMVTVGGGPVYLPPGMLPELASPEEAKALSTQLLDAGAGALKLMTASVVARPPSPLMPVPVVRAIADTAHARGVPVLVHPTDKRGLHAAIEGGADVLVHTTPTDGPWTADEVAALRKAGMALAPTLQLWRWELERMKVPEHVIASYEASALAQVRDFTAAGGELLFGTDVGYMAEEDPSAEYALLGRAGLGFPQVLAALTTAPARRFAKGGGELVPDSDADLVVVEGDPTADLGALARVRLSMRKGVVLHSATAESR